MSEGTEARRQSQLLAALFRHAGAGDGLRSRGPAIARGLAAYHANAGVLAERALRAAAPTVAAMLGEDDFARLARALWAAHPPTRGDLAEWGQALPAFIEAEPGLAEWPWLADAARLDLARHAAERAADAELDAGSLQLLAEADPQAVVLVTMPGLAVLVSGWPIATLHAAHHDDGPDPFAPVRAALAERRGEAACVARDGWRVRVQRLCAADAAFMNALLAGASLAEALQSAGAGFDFADWLGRAIAQRWLKAVQLRHDPGSPLHDGTTP